jgi:hypothetical protein
MRITRFSNINDLDLSIRAINVINRYYQNRANNIILLCDILAEFDNITNSRYCSSKTKEEIQSIINKYHNQ